MKTTRSEETILVVDDEKMIRDLAVEMLSQSGYTVITAPDGETAIQVFGKENNRIALVILDLIMPGWMARDVFPSFCALIRRKGS